MGALDTGLDFYSTVLDLRGVRQELLSANIANASTPGFKAVDLDFGEALAASMSPGQVVPGGASASLTMLVSDDMSEAEKAGIGGRANVRRAIKYQENPAVSLDGNSVDLNAEKLQAAQNALDYEATVNFTTQMVSMLMTAIKGSSGSSRSG
ncbi:MAG TPA: flagellar basal body rod protein FlgB [Stellaceae bacterium]|nr:flagellar basal body rod protein FlgB [Stellaceae bacterium]